ncbi:hypothetical protein ACO1O0_007108 [Amphichorda felina]
MIFLHPASLVVPPNLTPIWLANAALNLETTETPSMCFYTLDLNRCPSCRQVNTSINSTHHTDDHCTPITMEPLCPAGELRPATNVWLLKNLPELKCGSCLIFEMEAGVGEFLNTTGDVPPDSGSVNSNNSEFGTVGNTPPRGPTSAPGSHGSQSSAQSGMAPYDSGLPPPQQTPIKRPSQNIRGRSAAVPFQIPPALKQDQ